MSIEVTGMNGVVKNLHAANEALGELQEFERALNAFWHALSLMSELMREIGDDVTLSEELKHDEGKTREMIRDRVVRARTLSGQLMTAFGEISRPVRTWGVGERGASNRPRSAIETPPPVTGSAGDDENEGRHT